ncbi:penicillin-binding protein 2 [Neosynechococcus sphagnicola]|nr:penicillin-binding protein 2 [Neosynechococcus sphagnicola]
MLIVSLVIGACTLRLVRLQLLDGSRNRQLADTNRIRPVPIASDRGTILDRKGRPLATNRLTRSVYLWPREQTPSQWQQTASKLSLLLKIPASEILAKLSQAGYRSAIPVRISRDLTPTAFVALAENTAALPGLEIRGESSRLYPQGNLASHVLGYIGEATLEDLKVNPSYPMGMIIGRMGVERIANSQLEGTWGSHLIEVDAEGQPLRVLGSKPAVRGSAVQLTLDLDLQQAAEKALGQRRGAVVVLDVKTGAVLAMASGPSFDPNLFTRRISTAEWNRLQNTDNPFLNRALQGYPPGSTFKIVTSTAGMESGKFTPDSMVATAAFITVGGIAFHEHGDGYGVIGFIDALTYSSNTFFYQVGLTVGPEEIAKWGRKLGIGTTSNMGLDGGNHGSLPTPADKEKLYGEPWYAGDTVSMAIGQGVVQVTPLELAVMVSAIANGGLRVQPHLFASQTHTPATQPVRIGFHPGTLKVIRDGLVSVVQHGTGQSLNDGSIPLTGGKTGTAEVPGQPDNALWVGFGPVSNPQIAVAVVVENGGFGAVSAVPIAHTVYKAYFKKHQSPAPR